MRQLRICNCQTELRVISWKGTYKVTLAIQNRISRTHRGTTSTTGNQQKTWQPNSCHVVPFFYMWDKKHLYTSYIIKNYKDATEKAWKWFGWSAFGSIGFLSNTEANNPVLEFSHHNQTKRRLTFIKGL